MKNKYIGENPEICEKDYSRHEKGDPMMFMWRINVITNEIEALYHCKKCFKILHYPLKLNLQEQIRYNEYWKNKNENNKFKN